MSAIQIGFAKQKHKIIHEHIESKLAQIDGKLNVLQHIIAGAHDRMLHLQHLIEIQDVDIKKYMKQMYNKLEQYEKRFAEIELAFQYHPNGPNFTDIECEFYENASKQ